MSGRGAAQFELPASARLAHDLLWAHMTLTGHRPLLDDLEEADRLAALLIDRWQPLRPIHRVRWRRNALRLRR